MTRLVWYAGGLLVVVAGAAMIPSFWLMPVAAAVAVAVALRLWRGRSVAVFSCLAGLATPYVLVVMLSLVGPAAEEWWHETTFDAVAWRAGADTSEVMWPPRLCMVDDLIASGRLDGLSRTEVIALLGEPRERGSAGDIDYYLGPDRSLLRIDTESLVIHFDAADVVESYGILRD